MVDIIPALLTRQILFTADKKLLGESSIFGWLICGTQLDAPDSGNYNVYIGCELSVSIKKF